MRDIPDKKPLPPFPPQIDEASLVRGGDLYAELDASADDPPAPEGQLYINQDLSYTSCRGAEFWACIFRGCDLRGAQWKDAAFTDVVFDRCDLSNTRFAGLYLQRVHLIGCKLLGSDLSAARLRSVRFTECPMRMVNLSACKINQVVFSDCQLTEAGLQSLAEIKNLTLNNCDLTRAELLNMKLFGLDLTTCQLDGILLQGAPELRGAIVTASQALVLSSLLGLRIKE